MTDAPRTTAPDDDIPVGTQVLVFPGTREGRALLTRTRTPVWRLGGHTDVVSVEGYAGAIGLCHVEVIPAEVRVPLIDPMAVLVDQTIIVGDPKRLGNCVSACVASFLGVPLDEVPHFVELDDGATVDGTPGSGRWWWMLVGYMAARGLWPVELDTPMQADPGEVVFVAGPSPRGVLHQVLYCDGVLWHDPHPSRDGVIDVTEVIAWRPRRHDHTPTEGTPA